MAKTREKVSGRFDSMTKNRYAVLNILVLTVMLGFMVGCACVPGPSGGQAFAQKAGPPPPPPPPPMIEDPPIHPPDPQRLIDVWPDLCQRIHFDYDKSEIKPEWVDCLNRIAARLIENPQYTLIIEGHTDERGSDEYNMALGERRAQATANYLVQRGLSPNRIVTTSKGEHEPLATCSNESCWWQNRRAEFFVSEER
jgi:peptidoglycan-associated lipoprotein